jgi:hypothetical protein
LVNEMKTLILSTVAAAALMLSQVAHAEVKTYAKHGYWTNYAGVSNDGSDYICGMTIEKFNPQYQAVHIKYYNNTGNIGVEVFKSSWRIPNGTKVAVEFGFDEELWGGIDTAYGGNYTWKGLSAGYISFTIDPNEVKDFFKGTAEADKMWFRFPSGNETPWTADMTGSRDAVRDLVKCAAKAEASRGTQPYSRATPKKTQPDSQPFGNPSASDGAFEKKPAVRKPGDRDT